MFHDHGRGSVVLTRNYTVGAVAGFAALALAWLAWTALSADAARVNHSLATTFSGGNSADGNAFDLKVRQRGGVVIKRFDVHASGDPEPQTLRVWTRRGTSAGFENDSAGWRRRGTVEVVPRGIGVPTPARIRFALPRGLWGVMIGFPQEDDSAGMEYTDGTEVFTTPHLRLRTRTGLSAPFFGGGLVHSPRIWNGKIHYRVPCIAAKNKLRRARRNLEQAEQSGDAAAIAAASEKFERATAKKRRACS